MGTESLSFNTTGLRIRNSSHNIPLLVLVIINVILFAVMIFFNAAATTDLGMINHFLFVNKFQILFN